MLTLIDGNSLLFRAYYGVHSRLTRSDGTPTGAVYGFLNMILPVLGAAKPDDSFVCVFDASRISFRQSIYPEYKANRDETPADLITQSYMVRECMTAIGMPVLCIPGVEADDVIATLARRFCDMHDKTRIITSDKDLMQLVSPCVFLYDGMKETEVILKTVEVREETAYLPETLAPDKPVVMDVEKGAWFKVGVSLQNETETDQTVYVIVENVKVRIE